MPTRICIHCRRVLSLEMFSHLAGGREMRLSNICKECEEYAPAPLELWGSKPYTAVAPYVKLHGIAE